jgi:hypothetical protein
VGTDEHQVQDRRHDHPAEYGRRASGGPRAEPDAKDERRTPGDERERGHQDRPKPDLVRLRPWRRRPSGRARQLLGDDQDRVPSRGRFQHDHADLCEHVADQPRSEERERAEDRERHGEQDDQR